MAGAAPVPHFAETGNSSGQAPSPAPAFQADSKHADGTPVDIRQAALYHAVMTDAPGPTLAERLFAALAGRIAAGVLQPGEHLRQNDIAREFGASHVPVREAFRRLEAEGLVQSEPRRGVRVAALDRARHFEATEMRAVLEGLALRHAFERYPPAYLAALSEADRACSTADSPETWQEANRRFHSALIAPCAMPHLLQTIDRLQIQTARFALSHPRARAAPREDRDHKAILAALQKGDPDLAATLLTRHIRRGLGA
jgi:DNA-binding GntR family transcriptional regulator